MYLQVVTFKSELADAEVRHIMERRRPDFLHIAGLAQKHFCRGKNPGEYAGVYLWESEEAMRNYRSSDLAGSIPAAYEVKGEPEVQTLEVLFTLYPEEPAAEWVQAETGA